MTAGLNIFAKVWFNFSEDSLRLYHLDLCPSSEGSETEMWLRRSVNEFAEFIGFDTTVPIFPVITPKFLPNFSKAFLLGREISFDSIVSGQWTLILWRNYSEILSEPKSTTEQFVFKKFSHWLNPSSWFAKEIAYKRFSAQSNKKDLFSRYESLT